MTLSRSRTATAVTTCCPRGVAIRWTKGAEKQIDSIKKARSVRDVRDVDHADEIKQQLEALTVKFAAQAGGAGRLFGAVTVADIVDAVKAAGGPDIDKRRIQVGNPIKTVGAHQVDVKVHDEVSAKVNLDVVAS